MKENAYNKYVSINMFQEKKYMFQEQILLSSIKVTGTALNE